MEHEYWQNKWDSDDLGFHQADIHPFLKKYWETVSVNTGPNVFVPLCGKSSDMLWLREAGCRVTGVELSKIGVEAFFKENHLPVSSRVDQGHTVYSSDNIVIYCGDYFTLPGGLNGNIDTVFDRAALVAMPEDMRVAYIEKIRQLVSPATKILLITVEYATGMINPPPFVVSYAEVCSLYGDWTTINKLGEGMTKLKNIDCHEVAYMIEVNA